MVARCVWDAEAASSTLAIQTMTYKNKEQQREYQRQWMAKRRENWFAENGPCVICSSWEELELDHIDPELKETHKIWSWSKERREEELAKCQPLCVGCHAAKTRSENLSGHGTGTSYQRGCRCAECRAYKSAAMKRETRRQLEDSAHGEATSLENQEGGVTAEGSIPQSSAMPLQ